VKIELRKLSGRVKRKIAGLDFFVTKAIGPGRIAFSRDWPGQCIPLHLPHGQTLNVREHHFLAATDNVDYSFERVKGVRNMLLGGSGFFIDNFARQDGDAVVWVSGQGNVFEVELQADGEQIDVEAGGWLYKDNERQARVGLARAEDRHVRRRPQDDLQPLHRPRPPRDPDALPEPGRGRSSQMWARPRPAASRAPLIGGLLRGTSGAAWCCPGGVGCMHPAGGRRMRRPRDRCMRRSPPPQRPG
jgi:hypothetical protein